MVEIPSWVWFCFSFSPTPVCRQSHGSSGKNGSNVEQAQLQGERSLTDQRAVAPREWGVLHHIIFWTLTIWPLMQIQSQEVYGRSGNLQHQFPRQKTKVGVGWLVWEMDAGSQNASRKSQERK